MGVLSHRFPGFCVLRLYATQQAMLVCASDYGGAMKYIRCLAGACVIVLAGTTSTVANCGAWPKAPELPKGAVAGPEEMKRALDATGAFSLAVKNYADCLITAAQEAEAERNRLITSAQSAMDERNALVERWNAEAEAFRTRLTD